MDTYEFSTQITTTGSVEIPAEYMQQIPQGASVHVRIVVDKIKAELNGQNRHHNNQDPLEALIAEIKRTPSKPENIVQSDGLLAWRLAHPVADPDPNFNEAMWNQEWAQLEAEMKAASLNHEQKELEGLFP